MANCDVGMLVALDPLCIHAKLFLTPPSSLTAKRLKSSCCLEIGLGEVAGIKSRSTAQHLLIASRRRQNDIPLYRKVFLINRGKDTGWATEAMRQWNERSPWRIE
jgi:hypothetical protein